MLAPPDAYSCIEFGPPFRSNGFGQHQGKVEHGAGYWSDPQYYARPNAPWPTTAGQMPRARYRMHQLPILPILAHLHA